MRRRFPGQRRGEAGISGGDLDLHLHLDLLSLDRQGQTLGRSVLQALLDLPGDQRRCLGDRRRAGRSTNFKAQKDFLTNIGEGRWEIVPPRDAAGNCRADDRIAATRLGLEDDRELHGADTISPQSSDPSRTSVAGGGAYTGGAACAQQAP